MQNEQSKDIKQTYVPTELTKQLLNVPVCALNDFLQYPIIQYLGQQPLWSISDENKRPINIQLYYATGKVTGATFKYGNPLMTLNEVNQQLRPIPDNRVYHFHAKDEQIIMIDVESFARDEYKKMFLTFPCHYLEVSKNGGLHVVLHIPLHKIPTEYHYIFETTVIKHETKEFEVIFNKHYGTFTRKTIQCNYADFENNPQHMEQLLFFIQGLSKSYSEQQLRQLQRMQERIGQIEERNVESLESFLSYIQNAVEQIINETKVKHTLERYHFDHSYYESSSLNQIARFIYKYYKWQKNEKKRKKSYQNEGGFQELAMSLTEDDFIYLIYMIGKKIIPEREKHHELRLGMPWLLYMAQRSWIHIDELEQSKERKKQNASNQKENKGTQTSNEKRSQSA